MTSKELWALFLQTGLPEILLPGPASGAAGGETSGGERERPCA